uniref:Putative secreted protein n=1 Tax=Ixodes ricinus TaxID=34613 RepID=A0A6B0V2J2_IXORI
MMLLCAACPVPSSGAATVVPRLPRPNQAQPLLPHVSIGVLHGHQAATMTQGQEGTRAQPEAAFVSGHGNRPNDKLSNMPLLFVIQQMMLLCAACPVPSSGAATVVPRLPRPNQAQPLLPHVSIGVLHGHQAATMTQGQEGTRAQPEAAFVSGHGNRPNDKLSNMPLLFVIQQAVWDITMDDPRMDGWMDGWMLTDVPLISGGRLRNLAYSCTSFNSF